MIRISFLPVLLLVALHYLQHASVQAAPKVSDKPPTLTKKQCEQLRQIVTSYRDNGNKHQLFDKVRLMVEIPPHLGFWLLFVLFCFTHYSVLVGYVLFFIAAASLVTLIVSIVLITRTELKQLEALGITKTNFQTATQFCNKRFLQNDLIIPTLKKDAHFFGTGSVRWLTLGIFVAFTICMLCLSSFFIFARFCKRNRRNAERSTNSSTSAYHLDSNAANSTLSANNPALRQGRYVSRVPSVAHVHDISVWECHEVSSASVASELCPICLVEMNAEKLTKLPCEHVYHENCIQKWLSRNQDPFCPLCKTAVPRRSTPL